MFGQSQTNTGGGLFGSNPPGTSTGGGLFGTTNTGQNVGGTSGLFGSTNTGQALGGGSSGLFGTNTGQNVGGGGTSGLFGTTGQTLGGGTSGLFGTTGNTQANLSQQWMNTNPFGLGLQDQNQEAQLEVLKSQLMACGIDLQNLRPPIAKMIPQIQNPNLRTLQLLVHSVGRMQNLKALIEGSSELACFVFTRAPSVELAQRNQLQCDQLVSQWGAHFVQKLSRAKKNSPEPKSHYFTRPVRGFQELKDRVREQSSFFETFGWALKTLQDKQRIAHQEFTQKAVEKLRLLRQRQAEMRQKLICLVGSLEEIAARAQGFEGDDQELAQVEDEYERLQRQLTSNPECLQRGVPLLRERMNRNAARQR
eukprot:Gregarina_sp_Pseudo_9__944@NODE_1602_length_1464_cov_11_979649_g1486_i0_p1_GENE_NODE_1602_length_1464_cov_11_979649_g1486_i0NODE_1602_length_1464_cov_11_979649_g1486_i0_p1_ORF_typecomplete_len365_score61_43Nup54/PF13874_6/3_5e03Nup54/PF13874_6/2_7e10Nucleoporin_FG/PF13634_6/0_29Sua5_yciO_yrdC/PF01300_18/0_043RepC/PF06504_11/0_08SNARE/PF05739_19/9_1e03SNARE/PF05739_19/0_15Nup88/PF10168_9/6_4_NODE_1602_length_1464_cov_11_979649_g1486_i0761170